MRYTLIIWLSCLAIQAAEVRFRPFGDTRANHALHVTTELGDRVIGTREVWIEADDGGSKRFCGDLVVLFDSATGNILWEYGARPSRSPARSSFTGWIASHAITYVSQDEMALFWTDGFNVYAMPSNSKALSIDEAERIAIQELESGKGYSTGWQRYHLDSIRKLGPEFVYYKGGFPKVTAVTKKGKTWELTIQGKWNEKVLLDDMFKVVDMARID